MPTPVVEGEGEAGRERKRPLHGVRGAPVCIVRASFAVVARLSENALPRRICSVVPESRKMGTAEANRIPVFPESTRLRWFCPVS